MNPLTIVGEAPSKMGDGRPFTGPSGDRLQQLLGFTSYTQLESHFEMLNIFEKVTEPRWDAFDRVYARRKAMRLLSHWQEEEDSSREVLLCGRKVLNAFGVKVPGWFGHERRGSVTLWTFPHPSGLNHFWNNPRDVQQASEFLRRWASASCTHHPREQCPLASGQF